MQGRALGQALFICLFIYFLLKNNACVTSRKKQSIAARESPVPIKAQKWA